MEYEKWSDVFSTINADDESNVIEKIKEGLKEKDEGEYKKWGRANFDVNYQFECKDDKSTLLHFAAGHGCKDVVNALIKQGADINAQDQEGRTPLHLAAKNGHTGAIDALIKQGADINAQDQEGRTPLHLAAENGHTDAFSTYWDKCKTSEQKNNTQDNDKRPGSSSKDAQKNKWLTVAAPATLAIAGVALGELLQFT